MQLNGDTWSPILSKGPFKNFSFSKVNLDCILKHIKNINIQKASQESDIPNKIVKDNHDIFGPFIHKSLNHHPSQKY